MGGFSPWLGENHTIRPETLFRGDRVIKNRRFKKNNWRRKRKMNNITKVSQQEINALQDFFNALNGKHWVWKDNGQKIWNFTQQPVNPCDDWEGVICEQIAPSTGAINTISLGLYNLSGTVPPSVSNFTYLVDLTLSQNSITQIPQSLCAIPTLQYIGLGQNKFKGPLLNCLFKDLPSLVYLNLMQNKFTGKIPSFAPLANLTYLILYENQLAGEIPLSIQDLPNLKRLYLGYNLLSGSINMLTTLTGLERIALNNNGFTGTLSPQFSQLSQLSYVYLFSNQFFGSLPPLNSSVNMRYITLVENSFSGSISLSYEIFHHISTFFIGDNYLTSSIPNDIFLHWNRSQQFQLSGNWLTGNLPPSWSRLYDLQLLLLQENLFSGNPSAAFNASTQLSLQTVDISNNYFSGSIIDTIWSPSLHTFNSFLTCFDGTIPPQICQAINIQTLDFDGISSNCASLLWGPSFPNAPTVSKQITGGIPNCVWKDFTQLISLTMSGVGLTGSIPALSSYGNLSYLDLSFNSMTGTIPIQLQQWTPLYYFNLQSNRLSGNIDYIGALNYSYTTASTDTENSLDYGSSGADVTLSINRLSGNIPTQLYSAYNIDILEGNLFACSPDNPPPINDPATSYYVCGSNLLDISLFLFIPAGVIIVVLYVGLYSIIRSLQKRRIQDREEERKEEEEEDVHNDEEKGMKSLSAMNPSEISVSTKQSFIENSSLSLRLFLRITYMNMMDTICNSSLELMNRIQSIRPSSSPSRVHQQNNTSSDSGAEEEDKKEGEQRPQEETLYQRISFFYYTLLLWHSRTLQIRNNYYELLEENEHNHLQFHDLINLYQFLISLQTLRRIILILAGLILLITLPFYAIFKDLYGTYQTQYRWYLSGTFFSGYQPAVFIILLWSLLICFTLSEIKRNIPLEVIAKEEQEGGGEDKENEEEEENENETALPGNSRESFPTISSDSQLHQNHENRVVSAQTRISSDDRSVWSVPSFLLPPHTSSPSPVPLPPPSSSSSIGSSPSSKNSVRKSSITWNDNNNPMKSNNQNSNNSVTENNNNMNHNKTTVISSVSSSNNNTNRKQSVARGSIINRRSSAYGRESTLFYDSNKRGSLAFPRKSSVSALTMTSTGTTTIEKIQKKSFWISVSALIFNGIIMVALKTAFLLLLISSNTSFFQKIAIEIGISIIDLTWGAFFLPLIIQRLPEVSSAAKYYLKTYMLFFNSWIIPILILVVSDPSCFNGLFVENSSEIESFTFTSCVIYEDDSLDSHGISNGECFQSLTWRSTDYFTPSFIYNYDCYSTILISYIPIFLITYMLLSLLIPFGTIFLLTRDETWTVLDYFPGVFYVEKDDNSNSNNNNKNSSSGGGVGGERERAVGEGKKMKTFRKKEQEKANEDEQKNDRQEQQENKNIHHKNSSPVFPSRDSSVAVISPLVISSMIPSVDTSKSFDSTFSSAPNSSITSASTGGGGGGGHSSLPSIEEPLHRSHAPLSSSSSSSSTTSPSLSSKKDTKRWSHFAIRKESKHKTKNTTDTATTTTTAVENNNNSRSQAARPIIYPEFILSSATNHLLFMLTFGVISPALAVAIGFVTLTTTYIWEILIGRWIRRQEIKEEQKNNNLKKKKKIERKNGNIALIADTVKKLDVCCKRVCCCPRKMLWFLTMGSGLFFALIVYEMTADQQGPIVALWAPLVVLSLGVCFYGFFHFEDKKATAMSGWKTIRVWWSSLLLFFSERINKKRTGKEVTKNSGENNEQNNNDKRVSNDKDEERGGEEGIHSSSLATEGKEEEEEQERSTETRQSGRGRFSSMEMERNPMKD
jgi:hypothetical protein